MDVPIENISTTELLTMYDQFDSEIDDSQDDIFEQYMSKCRSIDSSDSDIDLQKQTTQETDSYWSEDNKFDSISILPPNTLMYIRNNDITRPTYEGLWKPGTIHSKHLVSRNDMKFYFEVLVQKLETEISRVAIGFTTPRLNNNKELPGENLNSYGYHSNGNIYHSSKVEEVNVEYGVGDIVGCYLDFEHNVFFYTKNGLIVNQSKTYEEKIFDLFSIPDFLYPTVGLNTGGTTVQTNFGEEEFKFPVQGTSCNFLCTLFFRKHNTILNQHEKP